MLTRHSKTALGAHHLQNPRGFFKIDAYWYDVLGTTTALWPVHLWLCCEDYESDIQVYIYIYIYWYCPNLYALQ